ncbi:sugar transporter ERD6-like 7 [Chenopodium quinoa]|uniref:sugar transporter ERD6-like 7 n=1 Tax=Chenopodium quinoa TaxID=63459 RepID=UPI000B780B72|nr:sugar transporter ERD6-like 7 [Chenopodium quinoa]
MTHLSLHRAIFIVHFDCDDHTIHIYLSTCVAVFGSYQFGACAGYSSPTQSAITAELHLSTAEFSLFGSVLTFGAMFGAITSGPIADFVGRKWAMGLYAASCVAGWLAIYFSKGTFVLDLGRLAGGYGMGAFSYVVPIYIAEISPVNIRGALTTLNQVMISTGVSVAFIIGIVVSWRTLALTGLIPCAIMILGLFLIPESPRWLARRGNQEYKYALQKLQGQDADITHEVAEIQSCIEELKHHPKANIFDLFQKKYIRFVIVGVGLMVLQQFGGINGICFYASKIFKTTGFSPKIGTVIYALLQVVIPSVGATLIDKAGRKPLLLVSATGSALGCFLTAVSFYLKVHQEYTKEGGILAATCILVYIAFYSVGMGPIPWVVMSEIFPINVKGVAGSLATLVNWFGAWAVSYTFNFLMEWSSYGTFLIFAATNALDIIFVIIVVPETNGRTLEEIQVALNG